MLQALRLQEVLTRVVAWHNRHPLARRIDASQVHSIGEVMLPFASAEPPPGGSETPPARAPNPIGAARAAAAAAASAARATQGLSGDQGHPAPPPTSDELEIDIALPGREAPPTRFGAASREPAPERTEAAQAAIGPVVHAPSPAAAPSPAGSMPAGRSLHTAADGPPPQARFARWRAALGWRGQPGLQAVFRRDFIWPLTPAQVARWARRHGQRQPLAPPDWPRRLVDADGQRLEQARQDGLPHTVHLHLLTAAIGVGDRRIRVLMDAQGSVIGPRAYDRGRVAGCAALLAFGVLGAVWTSWPPAADITVDPPALALRTTSPASAAPAPGAAAAAERALVARTGSAATRHEGAASAAPAEPAATASAAVVPRPVQAPEATPLAVRTPASGAPPPRAVSIRPSLSDDEKRIAREQATRLRGAAPAAAPAAAHGASAPAAAPVYAVVTRPSRHRQTAVDFLVTMRGAGARLPPPVPEHREVLRSHGRWHAAWWPFGSLAEAERARVMLAGRGLKADVIEF